MGHVNFEGFVQSITCLYNPNDMILYEIECDKNKNDMVIVIRMYAFPQLHHSAKCGLLMV